MLRNIIISFLKKIISAIIHNDILKSNLCLSIYSANSYRKFICMDN